MIETPAQMPSGLRGPSEKERKYDRQLRLWAASGQAALESANILLVNSGCGTVGVETLKNLVLPGIGGFTIADPNVVTVEDLGVNFFLDESCLGRSRAECCMDLLVELNPEVQGSWYPKSSDQGSFNLKALLSSSPPFTMVLYTLPLEADQIELIHSYGRQHGAPVIAVHSVGFYSYFKVTLPGTFPIVDTHPDETATTDLRLLDPWPELSEFAREMTRDIDNLPNHEHGHLPLVVILLHYLDIWRQNHDGNHPKSYAEKTAFRQTVLDGMRKGTPEGGEENFEEAVAAVMKHVVTPSIPGNLQEIFDYKQKDANEAKSDFWIIADAVRTFYQNHNRLPVSGGLPDMKAQSSVYIDLQNIYKKKARQDVNEVLMTIHGVLGREDIDPADVELFCKNARFVKLVNAFEAEPLPLEKIVERELASDEMALLTDGAMPLSLIPIYLALMATSNVTTASAEEIMTSVGKRVPEVLKSNRFQQIAQEVSRAAGGELHNISAMIGGCVAQEMIKVITKQYTPIDNVCIYDGIDSRCQVIRL